MALANRVMTSRTMIAAAVSRANSSWGCFDHWKTVTGRAVYGPIRRSTSDLVGARTRRGRPR